MGIAVCDSATGIVACCDRYRSILRREMQELVGRRMHDITHPEDVGRSEELIRQHTADRRPLQMIKRYVQPDGEAIWVDLTVIRLRETADGMSVVLARPLPEPPRSSGPDADRLAASGYISSLAGELSCIADQQGLAMTQGLLTLAARTAPDEALD